MLNLLSRSVCMSPTNVLFLGAGPAMINSVDLYTERFNYYSRYFSGDIITPVSTHTHLTMTKIANFDFHPFLYYRGNSVVSTLLTCSATTTRALKLFSTGKKYEVIISPNPLMTGLLALLIGRITRAKVLVSVNGNFEASFKFGAKGEITPPLVEKLKDTFSQCIIPFVLKQADMVKLLYATQLTPLNIKDEHTISTSVFHDFTPISWFSKRAPVDLHYILFVGYPWYLKGVDILIKAFKKISPACPDYRLKIVGWCPEGREFFEDLARGTPRIELCEPVYYEEVIKLMSECSLFVLPSRTEAMGRVLLEAMACRKPIIASRVGGIPEIINDTCNGLLFEKENIDDLAEKMKLLLTNTQYAQQLADNGFRHVHETLSEECYIEQFKKMVERTVHHTV
jgi:glycosyltransferase involved in cell wall biosynthesis